MTKLKGQIRRETHAVVREAGKLREIIVIMRAPNVLVFKAKGCRKEYTLTAETCYTLAVRADVESRRTQKAKEKKERRKCLTRRN